MATSLELLWMISDAHQADVSSLVHCGIGVFASGSRDGSVKIWTTEEGKFQREICLSESIEEELWVTALAANDQFGLLVGRRDGTIWKIDREPVKIWSVPPLLEAPERHNPIQCLTVTEDRIYAGIASQFFELGENGSSCTTDERDGVCGIHPLAKSKLLVAAGAELAVWEKTDAVWKKIQSTQQDLKHCISSIVEVRPELIAAAVFDGSVRVYNIETQQIVHKYEDHDHQRVWTVTKIHEDVLASGGEEGTVKLWDLRDKKRLYTLSDFPGRVSSLLSLDGGCLITASCPNDVQTSEEKAELSCWDLRV